MTGRIIFVLCLIAGVWWWLSREPNAPERPQAVQRERPLMTAAPRAAPPAPVSLAAKPAPKSSVQVARRPQLPEEPFAGPMEVVHFKVEEGLAIAFGDLILGAPATTEPITEGFNKPPPPRAWRSPEIPYAISPSLPNPERVETALAYLREKTVVNFVPFKGEADAIVFEPGEVNCKSYLGRVGGHQPIKLSASCGWVEVLHEVMHALGFVHEHSRTDRDDYLEINWENVQDEMKPQFAKVSPELMEPLRGAPFDYQSVMLYPPQLFAKRTNEETLRPKGGQRITPSTQGLSDEDIRRINRLFNR
ncbi:MAG TPA: M12 family metallopeptidase [Bdellovibrionales bacterium]|nr:M12 family metallopeptidase [Bdellovibrionales bacterium]